MWYVIQVLGGKEEKTAAMIQKQIRPSAVRECFIPKRERLKKFRGQWRQVEEKLFPGYVFADSGNVEELHMQLKSVEGLTKVLQNGDFCFLPLTKEEERWVKKIGDSTHLSRLSSVEITHDFGNARKVTVLDGPLKGLEGEVVKLALHKREAVVRIPFAGKKIDVRLGIEIVR